MQPSPAHFALAERMGAASTASSIIRYIGAGGLKLESYGTNFRDSAEATRRTCEIMARLVWAGVGMPSVAAGADAIRAASWASGEPLAVELHRWVKTHVRYVPDEEQLEQGDYGRELLIAPELLLRMEDPKGDCDDFTMVVCCLAISLGMKAKFVAVALEPEQPERFSHIFAMVLDKIDGVWQWVNIDASHGWCAGWEIDGQFMRYEREL